MTSVPPPPPPLPRDSGEPQAEKPQAVSQAEAAWEAIESASPEDIESTMAFVNAVRATMKWPPLTELPSPAGPDARSRPLSLALGTSVIKYANGGMVFALVYSDHDDAAKCDLCVALVQAGGNHYQMCEATREFKRFIHEIHLPRYVYDLAV